MSERAGLLPAEFIPVCLTSFRRRHEVRTTRVSGWGPIFRFGREKTPPALLEPWIHPLTRGGTDLMPLRLIGFRGFHPPSLCPGSRVKMWGFRDRRFPLCAALHAPIMTQEA